jgi:hypothetical protein
VAMVTRAQGRGEGKLSVDSSISIIYHDRASYHGA